MIWLYILLGIIALCFLLYLDFYFGKLHHIRNVENQFCPITTGDLKLYTLGTHLFNDMFQEIKDARHEVFVQFFIMRNDDLSKKLLSLLKEKAREGVTVRVLVDRFGGFRISYRERLRLKRAGVHFAFSSRPGFPFFFYRLNRRNHRKITVIDGKSAYVGGFNIGDEYVSKSPKFRTWRDYHLHLTGKIVRDLQSIFKSDWENSKNEAIEIYEAVINQVQHPKKVQAVATDGNGIEEMFFQFISVAEKEIIIGTPYFIPSETIVVALEEALEKGVAVKLLVPMKADHSLVKEAGIPYYIALKNKGAEIRLFDQGFYHGKLFIIDDKICDIGTANFDRRSFYINKEVNIIAYDPAFISEVQEVFLKDFYDSVEFSDKWLKQLNWWTKMKMPIARLLRPFL